MSDPTYTVPVPEDKAGARLDRFLADALPDLSRTLLKALIEAGRVDLESGGGLGDPAARVRVGQTIVVRVPAPRAALPVPQAMDLVVAYEDEHLIVVDKPAGLVVHPAPGHADGTLVNGLLAHCAGSLSGIGGVSRPGIVHRLDKDTSGLLVVAKTDAAHAGLAAQFADHSIERAYAAVVWGRPPRSSETLSGNIGRDPRNRKRMAVVSRGGKTAATTYRILRPVGTRASLVECRLETGRTHQIRVHLGNLGHPVVGDTLYGGGIRKAKGPDVVAAVAALGRQALHAKYLGFIHPTRQEPVRFESSIPYDINALVVLLENT
jgi:23S rRNA pseudouridine1911/1915/1917 synthase